MSLRKQTIRSFAWSIIDTFLVKGILFVTLIVLARILGPEDIGIISLITVFIGIGTMLVDSGMTASIIRADNLDEEDYITVFFANLGFSLLIYMVMFFIAPYISMFFEKEILKNIIRVYCLIFIISSLSIVQYAILNRLLNFKKIVWINIPATLIGCFSSIYLAYRGFGVWSIVGLYLIIETIKSILYMLTSSWKPKLIFSKSKFLTHYNFGYKLMLSGLIDQSFKYLYNIIIGKIYPVDVLGYFDKAKQLNEYPSSTINGVFSRISFPVLAKLKQNTEVLLSTFKKFQSLTFFIIAPILLGAAALSEELFELVLGKEWIEAASMFTILSFAAIFYPIHIYNLNILKIFGKSNLVLKLEVYKKIVIIISIIAMIPFGIKGLVWSIVISSVVSLGINTWYTSTVVPYKPLQQLKDLLPILIMSFIVFFAMRYSLSFLNTYSLIIKILVCSLIGLILYLSANFVYKDSPMHYSYKLYKNIISKNKAMD